MRSRAGSWSLAFVFVLSVLMIAGSSGPGFLALAQSDGTPAAEEPAPAKPARRASTKKKAADEDEKPAARKRTRKPA